MKSKLKGLLRNPMMIVFILIMIVFMPPKIFASGENRERGVVTAVGIDKVGDEYEVSFLVFIPSVNQSFDDKESVITGKGNSVGEAVFEAQVAMGRKIGLYHTKTTVVNLELMEEDGVNALDYFGRLAGFPENTIFICTQKSAKELLQATQTLREDLGFKLEQLVGFNADHVYASDTSLESFYRGYYSPTKSSLIGYLTLEDEMQEENLDVNVNPAETEETGSSGSGTLGGSSGGNEDGGKGDKKLKIINTGKSAIVKNGKIVKVLTLDQINTINLLNNKSLKQVIKIEDIEIEGERVNAVYEILGKKTTITTKFENGIPVFDANVIINLSLIELENASSEFKVNTEFTKLSRVAREKLDQKIRLQFADIIKILKEEGTDVLDVSDQFLRNCRKEYSHYVKNVTSAENFIKDVVFKLSLDLQAD